MSSQLLEELPRKLDLPIDYPSQRLLNKLYPIAVIFIAIVATLYGYFTKSTLNIVIAGVTGLILLLLVVLPPYPFYNRQKLQWVGVGQTRGETSFLPKSSEVALD